MNVFKIAWRSIQHRGLGSFLTVLSMALGVMMVVAVLSIHGVVSKSFRNNSSFGYNILVGARGGGMQLTMNTVYYLSNPVENVPYEYYLAFCDQETRATEFKNSIAETARQNEKAALQLAIPLGAGPASLCSLLVDEVATGATDFQQVRAMKSDASGLYKTYTRTAVPLCLGDYWEPPGIEGLAYRCVATTPNFFSELVLNVDTQEKFSFSKGRCFETFNSELGYFECVVGAAISKRTGLTVGDVIYPTHGDPESSTSHLHENSPFTVVGVVAATGTPNDRVIFLNMEGFFLMEDHAKPIKDDSLLKAGQEDDVEFDPLTNGNFDDEDFDDVDLDEDENSEPAVNEDESSNEAQSSNEVAETTIETDEPKKKYPLKRTLLPIEQREVTSILVSTSTNDGMDGALIANFLPPQINQGDLEMVLNWSDFRPVKSQKAAQAVNPVDEVSKLFQLFVDPVRWLLLALTIMICLVSAISILVGIYNSMNQRKHEIAVMRALGANRFKVMMIMLIEAVLLALMGGALGWIAGHGLNVVLSPFIEGRTGVSVGFFDLAPGIPIFEYLFGSSSLFPKSLLKLKLSPEVFLIPSLILLAALVGVYPAISAYKTDVAESLGK